MLAEHKVIGLLTSQYGCFTKNRTTQCMRIQRTLKTGNNYLQPSAKALITGGGATTGSAAKSAQVTPAKGLLHLSSASLRTAFTVVSWRSIDM